MRLRTGPHDRLDTWACVPLSWRMHADQRKRYCLVGSRFGPQNTDGVGLTRTDRPLPRSARRPVASGAAAARPAAAAVGRRCRGRARVPETMHNPADARRPFADGRAPVPPGPEHSGPLSRFIRPTARGRPSRADRSSGERKLWGDSHARVIHVGFQTYATSGITTNWCPCLQCVRAHRCEHIAGCLRTIARASPNVHRWRRKDHIPVESVVRTGKRTIFHDPATSIGRLDQC